MGLKPKTWLSLALLMLFVFAVAPTIALGQDAGASISFANEVSNARYSAVSLRRVGESQW